MGLVWGGDCVSGQVITLGEDWRAWAKGRQKVYFGTRTGAPGVSGGEIHCCFRSQCQDGPRRHVESGRVLNEWNP